MNNELKISALGEESLFWTETQKMKFAQQALALLKVQNMLEDAKELRVQSPCANGVSGDLVCRVYLCYKSKYLYTPMDALFDEAKNLTALYPVIEE